MLAAGMELGHSQRGNNNAYCQDNEISWLDWPNADDSLRRFTARLLELRRCLRPLDGRWYDGVAGPSGHTDLAWRRTDGGDLTTADWQDLQDRALTVLIGDPGMPGPPLALLINANAHELEFVLPAGRWRCVLDTANDDIVDALEPNASRPVASRSLVLLQQA
jgi:glycogen operon protein